MISLIHPSRSRPEMSCRTILKWITFGAPQSQIEILISIDSDQETIYREAYKNTLEWGGYKLVVSNNNSAIDAINNAAKLSVGDILIVVSDDTDCFPEWQVDLLEEVQGKTDWILKTKDGIQPWIITMPILDRAYYNRTGNIYDPDFDHMFCDTWLTVQADISGRKITSNLLFPHLNDSIKDEVRVRSDATWQKGEKTFIQKVKNTPIEDLKKITDVGMKNWIRNKTGIRL